MVGPGYWTDAFLPLGIIAFLLVAGISLMIAGGIVKGVTHHEDDTDGNLGTGDWMLIAGGIAMAIGIAGALLFVYVTISDRQDTDARAQRLKQRHKIREA